MSNTFLNIVIGLSAAAIGVLAFADEIGKSENFKIFKSPTFKIIVFLIATFFGILASVKKDSNSDLQIKIEKIESQKEQLKRDSLNRLYTDASNRKFLVTFTTSLIQYGLKYDSTKKEIERIVKDSTKRIIQNNYGPDPSLSIELDQGIKYIASKSEDKFKLSFKNYEATSRKIDMSIYCCVWVLKDSLKMNFNILDLKYLLLSNPFPKDYLMVKDQISDFILNTGYLAPPNSLYYFLVKGSYSNSDNTKKFITDELYVYSLEDKAYGTAVEPACTIVRKLLHNNKMIP